MSESGIQLTPKAHIELVEQSGVQQLLSRVRPHWKAKSLIQRVERLIPVDPSSACQRLFNAAIHDLKEKIVLAGLDIAKEAAQANRFPEVSKPEHIKSLDVKRTINLAFYMGLLTRPEWRRLLRVYDIRRDLEHEDDEYEATVEDYVYVFKTCVEVVLSRDSAQLLKLTDVKEIIEKPDPATLSQSTLEDYASAPIPRQTEIYRFLISTALDSKHPDIVRQNAFNALGCLHDHTIQQVILTCASEYVDRIGRSAPTPGQARVAFQAGILPYLKKAQLFELYSSIAKLLEKVDFSFRGHSSHGALLRRIVEVGGIRYCPDDLLPRIVKWLVLCCIGEPGGYVRGQGRKVFYSNAGAPLAREILRNSSRDLSACLEDMLKHDAEIRSCMRDEYVARRYEEIRDLYSS
ncbi:MAG: hypothetical protein WCP63_03655 [Cyanobium sp. ELA712]